MIRKGIVVKNENNRLLVCFEKLEMCSKCGQCSNSRRQEALVSVVGDAKEGSVISVEMPDHRILGLSVIMYVLPLIGLIAGLLIGSTFIQNELKLLGFGLVCMGLLLIVVKIIDNRLRTLPQWQPRLIETIDNQP